jgi:hypothetical protein
VAYHHSLTAASQCIALTKMMKTALMALALASLSASTEALSTTFAPKTSALVYDQLQTTPLCRASDEQAVNLPKLWRSGAPFGVVDEVAGCVFLRHFG